MDLKNFLKSALKLETEIAVIEEQIGELQSFCYGSMGDVRRVSREKADKLIAKLQSKADEYLTQYEKVDEFIQSIENSDIRALFRQKYLIGGSWEKIAKDLNMSLRSAYYWLKIADDDLNSLYEKFSQTCT